MQLDTAQQAEFETLQNKPNYKGARMIRTSWERKGHERGLREGEQRGLQKGLPLVASNRLGKPTAAHRTRVHKLTKPEPVERAMARVLAAKDLNDLLDA